MPAIPFTIPASSVLETILMIISDEPGARVVLRDSEYLRAEFRSRVLRLVDEVEFLVDLSDKLVHFRAAPRTGRPDFGANRRRMAHLSALIAPRITK